MREERGLGVSGLIGFQNLNLDEEDDVIAEEAMRRDWRYEEEEIECQSRGDKEGAKRAKEKRASNKRLQRVDVIYVSRSYRDEANLRNRRYQSCRTV